MQYLDHIAIYVFYFSLMAQAATSNVETVLISLQPWVMTAKADLCVTMLIEIYNILAKQVRKCFIESSNLEILPQYQKATLRKNSLKIPTIQMYR